MAIVLHAVGTHYPAVFGTTAVRWMARVGALRLGHLPSMREMGTFLKVPA
jgi:hypothetical protein